MNKISIKKVREEFQRWRKAKTGRAVVPVELREQALKILEQNGWRATCEGLKVSPGSLGRWRDLRGTSLSGFKKIAKKNKQKLTSGSNDDLRDSGKIKFVELPTPQASRSVMDMPGIVSIEWHRADGGRMKVTGQIVTAELERLTSSFLSGRTGVPT